MNRRVTKPERMASAEAGFTLVLVLTLVTIIAVLVAFLLPKQWSLVERRDREYQTIWVMKQYARGIQEFQNVHHTFPVSLEQLEKQTNPRVMRQMYPNPLDGKNDWILVPFSELNKPRKGNQPPGTPGAGTDTSGTSQNQGDDLFGDKKPKPPGHGGSSSNNQQPAGPFVGVRPPQTGASILSLNGATNYEDWVYTTNDLQKDMAAEMGQPVGTGPGGKPGIGGNPDANRNNSSNPH